jgi:hypothetical protein
VKAALRKVGRGIREVLLFPFRLIWWILRGFGHAFKAVGEFVEAIADGLSR